MKENYIKLAQAISYTFEKKYNESNPYTTPDLCNMIEKLIDKQISRHIIFLYRNNKVNLFYYIMGDATPSVITYDIEETTIQSNSIQEVVLSNHQDWVKLANTHTDYIFIK